MNKHITFNKFVSLMYPLFPQTAAHRALRHVLYNGEVPQFTFSRGYGKSAVKNWYNRYLLAKRLHKKHQSKSKPRKRKGL